MSAGVLGLIFSLVTALLVTIALADKGYEKAEYDRGWDDCEAAHNWWEASPDDELLLKEFKVMLKSHIKTTEMQRLGDIKVIDNCRDWKELKMAAWDLTIGRREEERRKK